MKAFFGTGAVLLLLMCSISLVLVSPSEARKKIVQNGCTMTQLDASDPKLAACYKKQDDDVKQSRPFLHEVVCMNGRYCCKHDKNGFTECEKIDRVGPIGGVANPVVPPLDPGPRSYNGPNNPQKPTTSSPH